MGTETPGDIKPLNGENSYFSELMLNVFFLCFGNEIEFHLYKKEEKWNIHQEKKHKIKLDGN